MKKIYFLFTFALIALVAGAQTTATRTFAKVNALNELSSGDKIVLISSYQGKTYAMFDNGGTKNPVKAPKEVTLDKNGKFVFADNALVLVLDNVTVKGTDKECALKTEEATPRYLKGQKDPVFQAASFTWSIDNTLIFSAGSVSLFMNPNGGTPIFRCYGSKGSNVLISVFKEESADVPGETVAAPVFSLEEGNYETAQSLTISCAADAKISYQINDQPIVKDQTSPVTVELPLVEGTMTTYTVSATAVKGNAESDAVTKVYKIGKLEGEVFSPITGAEQLQNGNKVVLIYKNDTEAYVADKFDSGHMTSLNLFENIVAGNFVNAKNAALVLTVDKAADSTIALKFDDGNYLASSGKNLAKGADRFVWTVGKDGAVEDGSKSICCNLGWGYKFRMYSPSASCPAVNIYKSATVEKVCSNPIFSLKEGRYTTEQKLNITTDMQGGTVVYAICATAEEVPAQWETVANPIVLAVGQTYFVKAKVQQQGYKDSEIVTREYIIKEMQDNEPLMAQILISEVAVANSWETSSFYSDFVYHDTAIGNVNFAVTGKNSGKYHSGYQSWSCEAPGNMTITLPEGFVFHHVEFFANLNGLNDSQITVDSGELCAHNAKNDPYVWNPKGLTNTVTFAPEAGKLFFEGFNLYIASSTSGVENAVAEEANVFGVAGGVKVVANAEIEVAVYTLAGQLVGQYNVAAGETMINLEQGFYVVRANENVAKVIVK